MKLKYYHHHHKHFVLNNDIRTIILMKYPNVKSQHIIISDPEDNVALIVGDNDVYQGWVKVWIKKIEN